MDNLVILAFVLACVSVVTFLIMTFMPKNEKKEKLGVSDAFETQLMTLIEKLSKKLEDMEVQDKRLNEKIAALQLMSGIEREQTKYLTANVNKTLYSSS